MVEREVAPLEVPFEPTKRAASGFSVSRWFPLGIALILLTFFHFRTVPLELAHYTDPIIYLGGAQSIAEGQGYRFITHAGMPRVGCHPPLNSAYLALFWKMNPRFPENVGLLYGAMFLLVLATFGLFYVYSTKQGVPPLVAAALIMAWGLTAQWGTLLWGFMSDVLFGMLALWLANYWYNAKEILYARRWLVTGVLVALMYLTRTAALAFIGVFTVVLGGIAWRRRTVTPLLAFLTPVILAIAFWKWWAAGAPSYSDYVRFRVVEEGGWFGVLKYNVGSAIDYLCGLGFVRCVFGYILDLPDHARVSGSGFSTALTALVVMFSWAFIACAVVGFWRTRTSQQMVIGALVGGYLIQLCAYPAALSERALYVVLPFILIWGWKGFVLTLERWPRLQILRPALFVLTGLCIIGNCIGFVRAGDFLNFCSKRAELAEVGAWLRANSPPDAVVAATLSEPIMHLYNYSGRRVVENHLQRVPPFSVVSHSTNGVRASHVLLCWYSNFKAEELNGGLQLEKASARGNYRLYRVTQP